MSDQGPRHHTDVELRSPTERDKAHAIPHEHIKNRHMPPHPNCSVCRVRARKHAEKNKQNH